MRLLVLGAGATGGYFGGRCVQAGRDVTFLVRPARQQRLQEAGLTILSPKGDCTVPVQTCTDVSGLPPFDVILLSCKAYDLDSALAAIAPAVGANTVIVPLLNGVAHLDRLDAAFGAEKVLGGFCYIAATVNPEGAILHMNERHMLTLGARTPTQQAVVERISPLFADAGFEFSASLQALDAMWEKYVFITTMAGMTCLAEGSVGEIMATPNGKALTEELFEACCAAARKEGRRLSDTWRADSLSVLTATGSSLTASMLRDRQKGGKTEHEHLFGFMLKLLQKHNLPTTLLSAILTRMQVYEQLRQAG